MNENLCSFLLLDCFTVRLHRCSFVLTTLESAHASFFSSSLMGSAALLFLSTCVAGSPHAVTTAASAAHRGEYIAFIPHSMVQHICTCPTRTHRQRNVHLILETRPKLETNSSNQDLHDPIHRTKVSSPPLRRSPSRSLRPPRLIRRRCTIRRGRIVHCRRIVIFPWHIGLWALLHACV
jgi:hypothetical protein